MNDRRNQLNRKQLALELHECRHFAERRHLTLAHQWVTGQLRHIEGLSDRRTKRARLRRWLTR